MPLTPDEQRFLQEAVTYLEDPPFFLQLTNLVGKPAEVLLATMPQRVRRMITDGTHRALQRALQWAIWSLPDADQPGDGPKDSGGRRRHTAVAAMTGAVGGFFGLAGAAVEIPITTTVMLRSIARIAADSGADLTTPQTRLECLAVFMLGSKPLEEMDSAYLTTRLGMSMALGKAAQLLAQASAREVTDALARNAAPMLARLISQIATRFEVIVSEKVAAQGVPIVGAATGSVLNAAFTAHFNHVARYHFGVLALERKYGADEVQAAYRHELSAKIAARPRARLASDPPK